MYIEGCKYRFNVNNTHPFDIADIIAPIWRAILNIYGSMKYSGTPTIRQASETSSNYSTSCIHVGQDAVSNVLSYGCGCRTTLSLQANTPYAYVHDLSKLSCHSMNLLITSTTNNIVVRLHIWSGMAVRLHM